MSLTHKPDQAEFRAILPEDINWQPFPAFPPAARLAIMVGFRHHEPHVGPLR